MSVDLVLRCDGGGALGRCHSTYTAEAATLLAQARHEATAHGWTTRVHTGGALVASTVQDLCAMHPVTPPGPHPADDPDRCATCGRTFAGHNVRHPFRSSALGFGRRPRQEPTR